MSDFSKGNDATLDSNQRGYEPINNPSIKTRVFTCILVRVFRIYNDLRERKRCAELALKDAQRAVGELLIKNRDLCRQIDSLKQELKNKNAD